MDLVSKAEFSGSEPPTKKARNFQSSVGSHGAASDRSKAIGKMFFKTKLCSNFLAGVCPYVTNCNFAHGFEELRRPPPNWQEIVAAAYDVSLSPSLAGGYGNGVHKPSNWKTRICNKWETTGTCPFGTKCRFAHGYQELHKYGRAPAEAANKQISWAVADTKEGAMQSKTAGNEVALVPPSSNAYRSGIGVPSRMPSSAVQTHAVAQGAHQKWRGPDKISKIYGDWIDDIE